VTQFIVAEVSKNWSDGREVVATGPIAHLFEQVIAFNLDRGYRLYQFSLHRILTAPSELNETIIAVFERVEP
jgi:hypothetical protein